jgi:integrase
VSVERVARAGGDVWRVRWRDEQGRARSRVIGRKRDADALDAELWRAKRLGNTALLENRNETISELAELWWRRHAVPNLERATRETYASILDVHIVPRLGGCKLRSLTPERVADLRAELAADGANDPTIRKTLALVQGILERGVEWGRLPSNPARAIRKPTQRRTRVVRPILPDTVEAIRGSLLARERLADATLISVLAYAGLRPGEALGLRWHDVQRRTLLVERAVSYGQLKATKTGRARTVRLLPPLAADLAAWRVVSRCQEPAALIFPDPRGRPWDAERVRNWRNRVFRPASEAAGLSQARPYDLRHSFVSLLIYEGASVVDVARQAGHAPTMTLDTYGHIFEELADGDRVPAETLIAEARKRYGTSPDVSVLCPSPSTGSTGQTQNPWKGPEPSVGLEPTTPSLPWKCSTS